MKFLPIDHEITFAVMSKSNIKVFLQDSELGAGTRGSSLGTSALKMASIKSKSDFFKRYECTTLANENERLLQDNTHPNAIRIDGIYKVQNTHFKVISDCLLNHNFPLVLSADHSSAAATIAGIKSAYPAKKLGVVWIDAHADLHSPYTTPSGNVHGMPLACSLGLDNEERQINDPEERTKEYWSQLKGLGGTQGKLSAEDLVFIGVRDTEEPEEYLMQKHRIYNHTVESVRLKGAKEVAQETLSQLTDCDLVYVSFDVDSMDPDIVSYGTGTPVANGLSPKEAEELIHILVADPRLCCFETVEVNPLLDNKCNEMAEVAMKIIDSTAKIIEK